MAKGFVLVDVPECCIECKFAGSDNKNWYCKLDEKCNDDYVLRGTTADNCPIRALPDYIHSGNTAYQNGHNELLEKILNLGFEGGIRVIKVIKYEKKRRATCGNCGALLTFRGGTQ